MATAYQDDIRDRMSSTGKKDYFANCCSITLTFTVFTPVKEFLTKDNKLSKTSLDFDCHKLFVDELARYFGFNDGLIWDGNVIKLPVKSDMWFFQVTITGEEKTGWTIFEEGQLIQKALSEGRMILE